MVEQSIRMSNSSTAWPHRDNATNPSFVPPSWLNIEGSREVQDSGPVEPESVLFVCTGNICRSAFAAAYLAHLIQGSGITVESAGIGALVGRGMDERALLLASQLGVDGSLHRARQLTGRMLGGASLVVVFGPEHYDWVQENNPEAIAKTVAVGQFVSGLEQDVGSQVQHRSISDLLSVVKQMQPVPDKSSWIKDPYKKDGSEYIQIMREVIDAVGRLRGKVRW
ncbi:arsenate reductase/protein-tyrosine-phosphatase family protein [Actinomyces weissii]|uniref:Phosphotyrosine protein phosphatase I domain-containing protein n=1 Tax=Actinomyces weissii TaxID=675090 RepID=A0A7T7MAI8_9ACTO|nr:hypothetical protein [Actinomyces weissii]QQM67929.1 hypothetical protein JG540_03445 [Actinomyces weissii]